MSLIVEKSTNTHDLKINNKLSFDAVNLIVAIQPVATNGQEEAKLL